MSRNHISDAALKAMQRLNRHDLEAYLVGGGVRDLLLGMRPKDFDLATVATPEEVRKLFRNCRLIGRRFRLAHLHFGREIIEVATFRGQSGDGEHHTDDSGRILRDNVYGTIEEDAIRRDFTINARYYDARDFTVRDYVGGFEDLKNGRLRLIGDPDARYREDPVRLLRAVRFAAKLDFEIDPATEAPMVDCAPLLGDVPAARLFDETLKLMLTGHAARCFELLRHYRLFDQLFPQTGAAIDDDNADVPALAMLRRAMHNTDERVAIGKPVTPAFLFAVLLWEPVRRAVKRYEDDMPPVNALAAAADEVISRQVQSTAIPRRFSGPMRDIWLMQPRFAFMKGKRAARLLGAPRFRAGYDFLLLRSIAEPEFAQQAQWWTDLQALNPEDQDAQIFDRLPGKPKRRRRRRPKKRDTEPTSDR